MAAVETMALHRAVDVFFFLALVAGVTAIPQSLVLSDTMPEEKVPTPPPEIMVEPPVMTLEPIPYSMPPFIGKPQKPVYYNVDEQRPEEPVPLFETTVDYIPPPQQCVWWFPNMYTCCGGSLPTLIPDDLFYNCVQAFTTTQKPYTYGRGGYYGGPSPTDMYNTEIPVIADDSGMLAPDGYYNGDKESVSEDVREEMDDDMIDKRQYDDARYPPDQDGGNFFRGDAGSGEMPDGDIWSGNRGEAAMDRRKRQIMSLVLQPASMSPDMYTKFAPNTDTNNPDTVTYSPDFVKPEPAQSIMPISAYMVPEPYVPTYDPYGNIYEGPCPLDCVFNKQSFFTEKKTIDIATVTKHFMDRTKTYMHSIVQDAIKICDAFLEEHKVNMTQAPPSFAGGPPCSCYAGIFLTCVYKHLYMNCPEDPSQNKEDCARSRRTLQTCDAVSYMMTTTPPPMYYPMAYNFRRQEEQEMVSNVNYDVLDEMEDDAQDGYTTYAPTTYLSYTKPIFYMRNREVMPMASVGADGGPAGSDGAYTTIPPMLYSQQQVYYKGGAMENADAVPMLMSLPPDMLMKNKGQADSLLKPNLLSGGKNVEYESMMAVSGPRGSVAESADVEVDKLDGAVGADGLAELERMEAGKSKKNNKKNKKGKTEVKPTNGAVRPEKHKNKLEKGKNKQEGPKNKGQKGKQEKKKEKEGKKNEKIGKNLGGKKQQNGKNKNEKHTTAAQGKSQKGGGKGKKNDEKDKGKQNGGLKNKGKQNGQEQKKKKKSYGEPIGASGSQTTAKTNGKNGKGGKNGPGKNGRKGEEENVGKKEHAGEVYNSTITAVKKQ